MIGQDVYFFSAPLYGCIVNCNISMCLTCILGEMISNQMAVDLWGLYGQHLGSINKCYGNCCLAPMLIKGRVMSCWNYPIFLNKTFEFLLEVSRVKGYIHRSLNQEAVKGLLTTAFTARLYCWQLQATNPASIRVKNIFE